MKYLAPLILIVLAGCPEPPKTSRMHSVVDGLTHMTTWDPVRQGEGDVTYNTVLAFGPEVFPILIDRLTDDRKMELLREPTFGLNPSLADACFLILLKMTGLDWKEFHKDGVFIQTTFDNPIFNIRWESPTARRRVQDRFLKILELADILDEEGHPK